ncbi:hypothetical protein HZU73_01702 [Apis mellifera caucasica]|uniref:Uncharacterized protein LOC113218943 n=1 Tax=Apis mellifera TaxID=7460 RepID=A0A7M7MM79_APIME|nr:uncharacterized protein LOC113218943 [Apis mellifera]XP_026298120.1 uncharacterized protein LOC113218943 [Apis mellifera]KAG6802867.1 hypothetical protein HZU73_01702 [Apis mellifera caucasica]|eukprot:XP_026298119.1 uncharacterized protein LOC113218943 [Apis mellifera]
MMGRKSEALCVVGGPRPNPDCPKSARMASYMQAACSLAVKQNGANCDHLCIVVPVSPFPACTCVSLPVSKLLLACRSRRRLCSLTLVRLTEKATTLDYNIYLSGSLALRWF